MKSSFYLRELFDLCGQKGCQIFRAWVEDLGQALHFHAYQTNLPQKSLHSDAFYSFRINLPNLIEFRHLEPTVEPSFMMTIYKRIKKAEI